MEHQQKDKSSTRFKPRQVKRRVRTPPPCEDSPETKKQKMLDSRSTKRSGFISANELADTHDHSTDFIAEQSMIERIQKEDRETQLPIIKIKYGKSWDREKRDDTYRDAVKEVQEENRKTAMIHKDLLDKNLRWKSILEAKHEYFVELMKSLPEEAVKKLDHVKAISVDMRSYEENVKEFDKRVEEVTSAVIGLESEGWIEKEVNRRLEVEKATLEEQKRTFLNEIDERSRREIEVREQELAAEKFKVKQLQAALEISEQARFSEYFEAEDKLIREEALALKERMEMASMEELNSAWLKFVEECVVTIGKDQKVLKGDRNFSPSVVSECLEIIRRANSDDPLMEVVAPNADPELELTGYDCNYIFSLPLKTPDNKWTKISEMARIGLKLGYDDAYYLSRRAFTQAREKVFHCLKSHPYHQLAIAAKKLSMYRECLRFFDRRFTLQMSILTHSVGFGEYLELGASTLTLALGLESSELRDSGIPVLQQVRSNNKRKFEQWSEGPKNITAEAAWEYLKEN